MNLRPYQSKAIQDLRLSFLEGNKRVILCAPTGAGKTVMFSEMVARAYEKGKRVFIVTDRIELFTQADSALSKHGLQPVKIEQGRKLATANSRLFIAMVETLHRRADKEPYKTALETSDLIIFDEAHKQAFDKIFQHIPASTVVIGATATPHREGKQTGLEVFYSDIVESISIPELIEQGYLAKPFTYGVEVDLSKVGTFAGDYDSEQMGAEYSRQQVYRGVIENYNRLARGKKAIVFASNIASSKELVNEFKQQGYECMHIDGYMDKKQRCDILSWFKNTSGAVLSNVGILTTGFDAPDIEAVILYRATKSLPLFLQMVGRGSRVIEGVKNSFMLFDFGNNVRQHGFWEQPRKWGLVKKAKKEREAVAPVKECKECHAIVFASTRICPYCEYKFELTKEMQEQPLVYLTLLTKQQRWNEIKDKSIEEKAKLARLKIISPYRVCHTLKTKAELQEFAEHMGWNFKGWWHHNKQRFPNITE